MKKTINYEAKVIDAGIAALLCLLMVADVSAAEGLKQAAVSVFNVLYGMIGVVGAIALLFFAVNMKFHWVQNPMKHFIQTAGAVFLAFSVVAIVQFMKEAAGTQSINSL